MSFYKKGGAISVPTVVLIVLIVIVSAEAVVLAAVLISFPFLPSGLLPSKNPRSPNLIFKIDFS